MLYELFQHTVEFPGGTPQPNSASKVILWNNGHLLIKDKNIAWPLMPCDFSYQDLEFLGLLDGKAYFTANVVSVPETVKRCTLREVAFLSETAFMLCARARSILDWKRQHKFCGQCGEFTVAVQNELAMACEPCRLRFYPKIAPCVIALVTDGDRVLLASGARKKDHSWYSTLAGYIEAGESAEQAVIREIKEEVGVHVGNIRYQNSQAWPFPNQLMLGFFADYQSGDIVPAPGEIEDAQWFDIHDLPNYPPSISIAGWLIRRYIEQRKLSAN